MSKVGPSPDASASREDTMDFDMKSLYHEDSAMTVETKGGRQHHLSKRDNEINFMKNNFKKRECTTYIQKKNSKPSKCQCGKPEGEHSNTKIREGPWKASDHTEKCSTDAFGEIEFLGYGDKLVKYVRVEMETKMESMLELLTNTWEIDSPTLLISVTGGAKKCNMKERLKEVFKRGLKKAAESPGAWIITGGSHAGVMSLVGEAVRDHDMMSRRSLVTIGIAPWGCVRNNECLINKENGLYPARYKIEGDDKNGETFLDPNHSHFILVDNGTKHQFGTEIELRTNLEEAISKKKTDTDGVSVPVCLLVLDGGVGTLNTVHSALKKDTPTVVIKDSGKCADILAYAVQNVTERSVDSVDSEGRTITSQETYLEEDVLAKIETMVMKDLGQDNVSRNVEWIKECTQKMDKISVFELDSKNSAKEVDLAILKALLKANKSNVKDQVRLALCWNRIDVAKMEIFTEDTTWQPGSLDDAMMMALKQDRVEFIQLFLDHGVKLEVFLTEERLLELYNSVEEIPHRSILSKLLNHAKKKANAKEYKFTHVEYVIRELLGDFFRPGYPTNAEGDEAILKGKKNAPAGDCHDKSSSFSEAQQLFIWAVLLNRDEMSHKFWMMAKESSAAALFATCVFSKMKKHTFDNELKRRLEKNAEIYEQRAVEVLNACYSRNEDDTLDNLVRNMPRWGSTSTCMLAYHSSNKRFLAQTACQSLLNLKWKGEMELRYGSIKVFFCTLFVFPILCLSFRDPNQSQSLNNMGKKARKIHEADKNETEKQNTDGEGSRKRQSLPFYLKLYKFYTAPIVKFILNVVFYAIFLVVYSYIMLIQMEDHSFHWSEIVLIIWVGSVFTEEIRQIFSVYSFTIWGKFKYYLHDLWNILDIVTILVFIVGMATRAFMTTETMQAARIILNINLMTFFIRVLHIFSVNSKLGPILVMISQMLKDLLYFVAILLVFVFAYAIASEAILYPNTELSWKLLYYLPRKAYWQMYGEIILDEIEGQGCTNNATLYKDYNQLRCPSDSGKYAVPVIMGIYVMMTSVLLLNLLIAMFSYTFQKIQEESEMHWCYQRFSLVLEYVQKPVPPHPFIILAHIYLLVKLLVRCCRRDNLCCLSCRKNEKNNHLTYKRCCHEDGQDSPFIHNYDEETLKHLVQWENIISDTHFSDKKELMTIEGRVSSCNKKIDNLTSRIDNLASKIDILQDSHQGHGGAMTSSSSSTDNRDVIRRMESIERQLNQFSKSFEWIMQSLQDSNMASRSPRPNLISIEEEKKEANRGEILARKERGKKNAEKMKKHISMKMHVQYYSRSSPYPGTKQNRFDVPDEKVDWEVAFPSYSPSAYTSPHILAMPNYADQDLLALTVAERSQVISFNTIDKGVNRVSLVKQYQVESGLPINPHGRTGLKGRGSLGRWGPNMCGDPIVTRWKVAEDGTCSMLNDEPQLEFVSVKRKDNNLWAIPGSICENDEEPWDILCTDFKMDVLGSSIRDPQEQARMKEKLQLLSKEGCEVYKGYADDPRNTDNAWLETRVINYHDDDGSILKNFNFRAGDDVQAVSWQTISSKLSLHGSHLYFLILVAENHKAAF